MARKANRWGKVSELDGRFRVGSPGYNGYPTRLKHLAAWRSMHKITGSHMPIRMYGTKYKVRPSSNLRLRGGNASKEAFVKASS